MKRILIAMSAVSLGYFSQVAGAADDKGIQLKDNKDKVSYSIGVDIGKSIQKQNIDINPDIFLKGLKDGIVDKPALMTDEDIRKTLLSLQTEMLEKQKTQMKETSSKNETEGQKFLAENKKRKDVVTLADGLQYRIMKEGSGASPKPTDMVTTHYRGKLINGTEFDSSYTRGEPVKFALNNVIPGWTEALQLMKPGAKWELFIPAKLAYGEHGVGQLIGPNATLIFEVELLSVDKAQQTGSAQSETGKTTQ